MRRFIKYLTFASCWVIASAVMPSARMAASDLRVFDAVGQEIGVLLEHAAVVMQVSNLWVDVVITEGGFFESGQETLTFYYNSNNCSGTRYMLANSMTRHGVRFSNSIYYPAGTATTFVPGTYRRSTDGFVCNTTFNPSSNSFAEASSFAMSHWVPPFIISR